MSYVRAHLDLLLGLIPSLVPCKWAICQYRGKYSQVKEDIFHVTTAKFPVYIVMCMKSSDWNPEEILIVFYIITFAEGYLKCSCLRRILREGEYEVECEIPEVISRQL